MKIFRLTKSDNPGETSKNDGFSYVEDAKLIFTAFFVAL